MYVRTYVCMYVAEVNQLETDREAILRGMQDGARRVLEIFCPAMGIGERAWKLRPYMSTNMYMKVYKTVYESLISLPAVYLRRDS
jgi:hypothetical protein